MKETEQLIKELWSLWESMAECGELHIGPKFSKEYALLKARVEQKLNKHNIVRTASAPCDCGEPLCNEVVDTVAAGWFCNQEEQVGKGYRCGKQCDLCKEAERKSSEEQP